MQRDVFEWNDCVLQVWLLVAGLQLHFSYLT